jgi:prevent-host-death family protein
MYHINIKPISDLRNNFTEIEKTVCAGTPVFLTKNGHGVMVVMDIKKYEELSSKNAKNESKSKSEEGEDVAAAETDLGTDYSTIADMVASTTDQKLPEELIEKELDKTDEIAKETNYRVEHDEVYTIIKQILSK